MRYTNTTTFENSKKFDILKLKNFLKSKILNRKGRNLLRF